MSATAAKASRRDIRRALGPTALELIDAHTASLTLHAQRLTYLKTLADGARVDIAKLAEGQGLYNDSLHFLRADLDRLQAVRSRGFWGRVQWLVTGQ